MRKHFGCTSSLLLVFSLCLSSAYGRNLSLGQNDKTKTSQTKPTTTPAKQPDGQAATPAQTTPAIKTKRRTIAVLDFGDASLTILKKNLGRQLAILLSNAFTKQGDFIVVERIQLDRVTDQVNKEQDTDRFNENTLVRIGKLLKADALILGDITEFTATKKGKSYGIASKTSFTAKLGLAVRLVDISSGEVLDAISLEESADEKGESNPFWSKGAELDEDLKVTLFTKAANQAVEKTVIQLNRLILDKIQFKPAAVVAQQPTKPQVPVGASSLVSAPAAKPVAASQSKIVKLEGSIVTINVGSTHGVKIGHTFLIVRQEVTTDPDTNEVLDRKDTEIGRIKITEVRDGISIGSLAPGSRNVKVRDLVKALEGAQP